MMPYKRTSAPEHVRQLLDDIEKYHDIFCTSDDPEAKSDALRLMKGYAAEYLNQVVHCHKFKTAAVGSVLNQSVFRTVDFDAREASEAFEHLAKYAQNLLEQPWREEFRVLILSSGYYVHNIQAYLENPHEILIAMGYANINDDVLQLASAPIPALLKQISRDCFLASQECLILSKISDFVQTQTKRRGITPAEIYTYRSKLTGDVATIGTRICYELHRKQHDEQFRKSVVGGIQQQHRNRYGIENYPIDELVNLSGGSVAGRGVDLPEREIVRNVLHNTQREREQEHIYDPVPAEDLISRGKLLSPNSPSINSSSSNFVYQSDNSHHPGHNGYAYNHDLGGNPNDYWLPPVPAVDRYAYDTRSSTASPYIPKTVSTFDSMWRDGMDHRKPSSSSSSASSRGLGLQQHHQALEKMKVPPDELHRRFNESTALNHPNWLDMELQKQNLPKHQAEQLRKPMNALQDNLIRTRADNSKNMESDDILNEAYRYSQETSSLMKNRKSEKLYARPQYEIETSSSKISSDSRHSSDRDSENKSSASSETSSWGFTKDPTRHPTLQWYGAQRPKPEDQNTVNANRMAEGSYGDNGPKYETEYKREFKPKNKLPPMETDLDSFETFNPNCSASKPVADETEYTSVGKHNNYPEKRNLDSSTDEFVVQVGSPPRKYSHDPNAHAKSKVNSEKAEVATTPTHVEPEEEVMQPWSCPHCTYNNHTEEKICQMCSKTRDFAMSEEDTRPPPVLKLVSDSAPKSPTPSKSPSSVDKQDSETKKVQPETSSDMIECPFCTYMNPKVRVICEVCENRLKNNNLA